MAESCRRRSLPADKWLRGPTWRRFCTSNGNNLLENGLRACGRHRSRRCYSGRRSEPSSLPADVPGPGTLRAGTSLVGTSPAGTPVAGTPVAGTPVAAPGRQLGASPPGVSSACTSPADGSTCARPVSALVGGAPSFGPVEGPAPTALVLSSVGGAASTASPAPTPASPAAGPVPLCASGACTSVDAPLGPAPSRPMGAAATMSAPSSV